MDKQKLLGKKTLTDFEARWLADRNVDHPALAGREIPNPDAVGDDDVAIESEPEYLPAYEDMSHAELAAEASARGLAKNGSKVDLIERLQKFDDENVPE
jgi:hypothetical protein